MGQREVLAVHDFSVLSCLNEPIKIQQAEKTLYCPEVKYKLKEAIEVEKLSSLKTAFNVHKKGLITSKAISDCKT